MSTSTSHRIGARGRGRPAVMVALGTACILLAPHLGVPVFLYPVLGLGLCAALLRWQGLRFADLDFRWRGARPAALLVGGSCGLVYAAINYVAIGPAIARLTGDLPDLSAFAFVRKHLSGYLIALAAAWVIGGLYEELVFRGFLRTMLLRHLPGWAGRPALAIALTALAFAAYHAQLGWFGVINALMFALIVAWVRRRWPENLWYPISFHACADMAAFTLIRYGYL